MGTRVAPRWVNERVPNGDRAPVPAPIGRRSPTEVHAGVRWVRRPTMGARCTGTDGGQERAEMPDLAAEERAIPTTATSEAGELDLRLEQHRGIHGDAGSP